MDQNFVAPGTMAELAPGSAARRAPARAARTAEGAGSSAEATTIGSLRSTASIANMPVMGEFAGMAGGWALGGLTGLVGLSKTSAWLRSTLLAPFSALRRTTLDNLRAFPAHYHAVVAERATEMAQEASAKGKMKLATAAQNRAASASIKAAQYAPAIKPLERVVDTAAAPASGIAGKAADRIAGFTRNRHEHHLNKAIGALTEAKPSLWQRITFQKPAPVAMPAGLSEIQHGLAQAKNLSGAALVNHMNDLNATLASHAKGEGELAKQAAHVMRHAGKAATAAASSHGFAEAAKQGLSGIAKMLAKSGGRASVFGSLVALGTTAGIGATWLSVHQNHAKGKAVIDQMSQAIGPGGEAYIALVQKAAQGNTLGNMAKSGLSTVGEAASGAMIAASQQAAMGGAMMAASFLPMVVGEAVSENPVVAAYQALGNPELTKEQRVMAIKQLFAILPSVAAHGGIYNRLNSYMATHLADKKMSREDVIRLAANDKAFNALAAEMNEKMKAEAAPKVAQPAPAEAKQEVKQPHAASVTVIGGAKAANEPNHKGISQIQNLGRVADAPELKRA